MTFFLLSIAPCLMMTAIGFFGRRYRRAFSLNYIEKTIFGQALSWRKKVHKVTQAELRKLKLIPFTEIYQTSFLLSFHFCSAEVAIRSKCFHFSYMRYNIYYWWHSTATFFFLFLFISKRHCSTTQISIYSLQERWSLAQSSSFF